MPELRVIAYLRRSTDRKQETSLESQAYAVESWAARQGAEVVAAAVEDATSGGAELAECPALLEALDLAKAHKAGIAVYRRDRLARDILKVALVTRALARHGGRIWAAEGGANETTPEADLINGILDQIAVYERRLIGARTRASRQAMLRAGRSVGSIPPLGYREVDGLLIVDRREQEMIEGARYLRAEGRSWRQVARILTDEGYRTREGRPLNAGTLHRALKSQPWRGIGDAGPEPNRNGAD